MSIHICDTCKWFRPYITKTFKLYKTRVDCKKSGHVCPIKDYCDMYEEGDQLTMEKNFYSAVQDKLIQNHTEKILGKNNNLHKRSQFTLLLDTEELKRLKEEAMKQGISTNKYINSLLSKR